MARTEKPLRDSRRQPPNQHCGEAGARLREILRANRESGKGGTYAVCSAHVAVIEAAVQQSLQDGSILHVESTSSQVNQFGGYSGSTPSQFAHFIRSSAEKAGLPNERILLGGDHLGPFPWRAEPSGSALRKACELVRDCVLAGYQKIHLDASMPSADDQSGLPEKLIAERAALLCQAAEEAFQKLSPGSPPLMYVIGSEVPAPGGESVSAQPPPVTTAEHANRTLQTFRGAFAGFGLSSAWQRVIALVVQPGVDFGANAIFDYDPVKTQSLSAALSNHAGIVFEAHSTDYQSPQALTGMIRDHFAILKVGPWLTFAYREAVLALSSIERALFETKSERQLSRVREQLEDVMLRDPSQWRAYYHGSGDEVRRDLTFAFSDRCRYYWNQPVVQAEISRLLHNLAAKSIPLALVSQYLPLEYEAIRAGALQAVPEQMIQYHIRRVLGVYANACSA
ncbi:MAG TPA: class II D-tagatose-bisphosphate aldolase, non-catalytic subunit [Terriglobales bacterium]|nr:class II D-tagatose-bisphosphate aldolase, non-catalytic subunit [Terriglobales bacterium]